MSAFIDVQGLHKIFKIGFFKKKVEVLRGVDFVVEEGEIFGFLGPNGCGKTTTIKIMLGLIFADSGTCKLMGRPTQEIMVKKEIGFLPDSPYFYNYLTGEEFLDFYGQLFGFSYKERHKKISFLLNLVDLERARKLQLRKYSRGMLQRIGMAQALINDPKLVIMDEPMEGLDPIGRKLFRDIILKLREEGKTVFFSTHILSDAEMICDRVAIMVKGRIKGMGELTELLKPKVQSVDVALEPPSSALSELSKEFPKMSRQGNRVFLNMPETEVSPLLKKLIDKKIPILSVIPHKEDLEHLFMSEVS